MIARADRSDYSFGDTATAEERLAHVARVFEAPSRALLEASGRKGCALAVDLADPGRAIHGFASQLRPGGRGADGAPVAWGLRQLVIET